jgi:putative ABC transport system ATP-binding protein
MSLIQTKNLKKTYSGEGIETTALKDVTLTIEEGEFVAIIGPSGSGKSTLMQILGLLDRTSGGSYMFDGKEATEHTDEELAKIRNQKIGFVFQAFNLLPRLSVLDNVALPLIYRGTPEKARQEKAMDMIRLVGLEDRAQYRASQLSGGQKQRVAIARALVNDAKIIFADEPTGNLDSKSGGVILDFLQKLNDQGHTIVIVTHESYVAQSAKRVLHIVDGNIDKDEKVVNRRKVETDGFTK